MTPPHFIPKPDPGRRPSGAAVQIVGGGLAGLALGLVLRRQGVPATIFEAGHYPRHRVCGEFISGLEDSDIEALGLAGLLAAAPRPRSTTWYRGNCEILRQDLPEPAIAISRHELDAAMARQFVELGGDLQCGRRLSLDGPREGWVAAHGRPRAPGRWLGLKAHFSGLPLATGLEMHLGRGGYAGLTQLQGGRVNVCALLPAGLAPGVGKAAQLPARLEAVGLSALAARLRAADGVAGSVTGVTQFSLGWQDAGPGAPALGDSAAIIPPFTGHGMAMALQSAVITAPFVAAWSRGELGWTAAVGQARAAVRGRFASRLRWAGVFHPMLLNPAGQAAMAGLARWRILPFAWLFHRVR